MTQTTATLTIGTELTLAELESMSAMDFYRYIWVKKGATKAETWKLTGISYTSGHFRKKAYGSLTYVSEVVKDMSTVIVIDSIDADCKQY